jgi:hypothetical protein
MNSALRYSSGLRVLEFWPAEVISKPVGFLTCNLMFFKSLCWFQNGQDGHSTKRVLVESGGHGMNLRVKRDA